MRPNDTIRDWVGCNDPLIYMAFRVSLKSDATLRKRDCTRAASG